MASIYLLQKKELPVTSLMYMPGTNSCQRVEERPRVFAKEPNPVCERGESEDVAHSYCYIQMTIQ